MEGVAEGEADLEPLDAGEVAGDAAEQGRGDAGAGEVERADGAAASCDAGEVRLCSGVEADESEHLDGAAGEDGGSGGGVTAERAETGHVGWEEAEWARVVAELEVEERRVVAQDELWGLADATEREVAQVGETEGREEGGRGGGEEVGDDVVGETEGELERMEVAESGHEGLGDVLGDEEEQCRALDRVCLPSDVEAPDILREVRVGEERFAAAQGDGGHGGHSACALELRCGGAGQDLIDEDGGVQQALRVGAPSVGDEDDTGERLLGEVVKDSVEYLVREVVSGVGSDVGFGQSDGRHGHGSREGKKGTWMIALVDLGWHWHG